MNPEAFDLTLILDGAYRHAFSTFFLELYRDLNCDVIDTKDEDFSRHIQQQALKSFMKKIKGLDATRYLAETYIKGIV